MRQLAVLLVLVLVLLSWCFAQDEGELWQLPEESPSVESELPVVVLYKPSPAGNVDSQALLDEILSQPEFSEDGAQTQKEEGYFDKIAKWFSDAIQGLFDKIGIPSNNWFGIGLVLLLIGLLIYLVVRLLWELNARRVKAASDNSEDENKLSLDDLIERANDASSRGEYRSALRYRYLALLRKLNITQTPLMTNRQLVKRVKRDIPLAADSFAVFTLAYEDSWYGQMTLTGEQYNDAENLAKRIEDFIIRADKEADQDD